MMIVQSNQHDNLLYSANLGKTDFQPSLRDYCATLGQHIEGNGERPIFRVGCEGWGARFAS
jgi:hypothetical protein